MIVFIFADCGFDVHKKYVQKVEETCVGPTKKPGNEKVKSRKPKFIDRILPPEMRDQVPGRKQSSPGEHKRKIPCDFAQSLCD